MLTANTIDPLCLYERKTSFTNSKLCGTIWPQGLHKIGGLQVSGSLMHNRVVFTICWLLEGMFHLDFELSFLDFEPSVSASVSPTQWPQLQPFDDCMHRYVA